MGFWEFEINFFDFGMALGILTIIFLVANTLRRKVRFLTKSLLPTAMIAGLLTLILKTLGVFDKLFNIDDFNLWMENITYHSLGLGVIAMTLKTTKKEAGKKRSREIMDAGLLTVNTYLIQAIIGVIITVLLYFLISTFPAAGFILPLGFGQGSGQALTFGRIFEETYNFKGGASFGLTVAAIGFLVACLVGVLHIALRRRKGFNVVTNKNPYFVSNEILESPNEVPVTEAVDRLSIQIALIALVYFLTFLFMYGVENLPIGKFGTNTVKPMIWGFNFLIGSLIGVLIKQILKKLRERNIMTRDYPNDYLLNRISGFMFDLMIVAGVAGIEIAVLKSLIIPLSIICIVGTIVTYFYVRGFCYYLFPEYKDEAFVSMFGMLTGTNSTGMILLREVDPGFATPAANNLIYQSFWAIAFGFPLFLLLGYAPKGLQETLISLTVVIVMFIIFNIILLRRKIFRKLK